MQRLMKFNIFKNSSLEKDPTLEKKSIFEKCITSKRPNS